MTKPFDASSSPTGSPASASETTPQYSSSSAALHRLTPVSAQFHGVQLPVYKASTVYFQRAADMRVAPENRPELYTYGLHGTPAQRALAQDIAALEGGAAASLYPSGLAAIAHLFLSLLQQGDAVLLPHNVYSPAQELTRNELTRFGISYGFYDPLDGASLQEALRSHPNTKLVWFEAAGSLSLEFPNLPDLLKLCRTYSAQLSTTIWTALDNTWGAGLAFNAFALGFDYTVHALTKYPGGGADVLMGAIVAAHPEGDARVRLAYRHYGWGVSAEDVYLVLRSLATIELRYRAQDQNARALAQWLSQWPEVSCVMHPALSHHDLNGKQPEPRSHHNWQQVCGAFPGVRAVEAKLATEAHLACGSAASLFSAVFAPTVSSAQVDAFAQQLQLFKLGYSWAGPVSLVVPYSGTQMATLRPQQKAYWQAQGPLLRFAIGLEPQADLRCDLLQAKAQCLRG